MNETIELLLSRRSERAWADSTISAGQKELIMRCAMRAPTAGNMMLYSILEVADQEKKERLVVTCDDQPFIARSPLVLVFLADMQRWFDYYRISGVPDFCRDQGIEYTSPQEADLMLACCDALIAAQNAVIAAESMGIGSCYIGDIMENYEIHREMFELPRWVFPVTMLCFGPSLKSERSPSSVPRFPSEAICFKDKYERFSEEQLQQLFDERYRKQFGDGKFMGSADNVGQHFYLKKTGSQFFAEMRRSVKAALASWRTGS